MDDLHALKRGTPGRRFTEVHERHRAAEHGTTGRKTALYITAGALLLVAGLLLSIPPGIPGFLLWIPGLSLLVARLRPFALFLDRAEAFLRRLFGQDVPPPRSP